MGECPSRHQTMPKHSRQLKSTDSILQPGFILSSSTIRLLGKWGCSDYVNVYSLHRHTHTPHWFNGPFSGTTQVSRYQKGKTNLDFTEARDSEWQWHQLGHMQVCTSLQTDNHASTPSLSFLQAGCPFCRPTNSVKALKANQSTEGIDTYYIYILYITVIVCLSLCLYNIDIFTKLHKQTNKQTNLWWHNRDYYSSTPI